MPGTEADGVADAMIEANAKSNISRPDPFGFLRKAEMKRLKNTLLQEEYTKLKNIMWILRKDSLPDTFAKSF